MHCRSSVWVTGRARRADRRYVPRPRGGDMDEAGSDGTGGRPRPDVRVEQRDELDEAAAARLRAVYLRAFEPMRTQSIVRIVMSDDEWQAMVVDNPTTRKFVGLVDGEEKGLLVVTNRP